MSKNSRRNQKAAQNQDSQGQQTQQNPAPSPTVNPVQVGSQKGGKNKVPQTRQQAWPKATPQDEQAADKAQAAAEAQAAKEPQQPQQQAQMPKWAEEFLQQLAKEVVKNHNDIEEDHQVLIDHGVRLDDIEKVLGLEPIEAPEVSDVAATQPIEVLPSDEDDLTSEDDDVLAPADDDEAKPQSDIPANVVPRQMYEAESFEDGVWRKRGPYRLVSKAKQVAKDDLSRIKIVQVWYNTDTETIIRYLTPEEMDKYCR